MSKLKPVYLKQTQKLCKFITVNQNDTSFEFILSGDSETHCSFKIIGKIFVGLFNENRLCKAGTWVFYKIYCSPGINGDIILFCF